MRDRVAQPNGKVKLYCQRSGGQHLRFLYAAICMNSNRAFNALLFLTTLNLFPKHPKTGQQPFLPQQKPLPPHLAQAGK